MFLKASVLALMSIITTFASSQPTCSKYVLISIRGTNEAQGPIRAFAGMINTTLNTLPGGIEYDLVYPATLNFIPSFIEGSLALQKYIKDGLAACPDQKYAILGYSQGAVVAALGLAPSIDKNSATYKAIKGVLVIGNPGHVYGASVNFDQLGGHSTQYYVGALAGLITLPQVYYGGGKVLDICYQADIICALGSPNSTFISPDPSYIPPHGRYADSSIVQNMAADFLIKKLR